MQGLLRLNGLVLLCLTGLFGCFALRELQIGAPEVLVARWSHLTLFPWGVFAVAFWRLRKADAVQMASPGDIAVVTALAALAIPLAAEPSLAGLGLVIGGLGAFTLLRGGGDADLGAASVCLLALLANFTLAPLVFRIGYGQFIGLDIALIQTAIDWIGAPVTVTPGGLIADDGNRVMLVGACSSFAGVSGAILVHMGWAMALRTDVGWRDGVAVMATVLVATALNVLRLTLTASGHEAYAFWHGAAGETPMGGQIFWFAHNAVLLTGGYLSAIWAGGRAGRKVAA